MLALRACMRWSEFCASDAHRSLLLLFAVRICAQQFFNSRGQSGTPSFAWRRRTGGYRGGFLLSALELWLKEDMKKNLRVLSELDLVPSILGSDFSFLFLQDFQGQVTMVPNASLRDFAKVSVGMRWDSG